MKRILQWFRRLEWPHLPAIRLNDPRLIGGMFSPSAVWQLVFLISATFLLSLWNLDSVRLYVFDALVDEHPERAARALEDSSDKVASMACIQLLNDGNIAMFERVVNVLYRRPQVAFQCLEMATIQWAESQQPAAADDAAPQQQQVWPEIALSSSRDAEDLVPSYVLVASSLAQRWTRDLIDGSDNTCQTAYHTRRAMELAWVDPSYRLMSCAVGADSPQVRECCVTQLGGHQAFIDLLSKPELAPIYLASIDYRALVGSAFPSVPLASELIGRRFQPWMADAPAAVPASGDAGGGERFGPLQFDVQDWVVEVGCRVHFSSPSRQWVPAAFVPLVESHGCAPTSPPWEGMYSPASWTDMCLSMYAYRRKMAFTPKDAICSSLAVSAASRTITRAELEIASAHNSALLVPGVRRKEIKLVGDNFGERVIGFQPGPKKTRNEDLDQTWRSDPHTSPMGAW